MQTGDAYSSEHLVLSHLGFANVLLLRPLTLNHALHNQFMTLSLNWLLTELDSFSWIDTTNSWHFPWFDSTEYRFPWNICNGCGMLTGNAYSSERLVPSLWDLHFLLVETNPFPNLSLFYRTLLFEYPSVLSRFCFLPLPMYHCWWTNCPRGYLSGSNFIWMTKKVNLKVAGTSPTIKRSQTGMSPDLGMSAEVGVPHVVLRDITN